MSYSIFEAAPIIRKHYLEHFPQEEGVEVILSMSCTGKGEILQFDSPEHADMNTSHEADYTFVCTTNRGKVDVRPALFLKSHKSKGELEAENNKLWNENIKLSNRLKEITGKNPAFR
jgi:alkyl hydroperoxide reductase subunit AhpC